MLISYEAVPEIKYVFNAGNMGVMICLGLHFLSLVVGVYYLHVCVSSHYYYVLPVSSELREVLKLPLLPLSPPAFCLMSQLVLKLVL